jgi:hypothetical protein
MKTARDFACEGMDNTGQGFRIGGSGLFHVFRRPTHYGARRRAIVFACWIGGGDRTQNWQRTSREVSQPNLFGRDRPPDDVGHHLLELAKTCS